MGHRDFRPEDGEDVLPFLKLGRNVKVHRDEDTGFVIRTEALNELAGDFAGRRERRPYDADADDVHSCILGRDLELAVDIRIDDMRGERMHGIFPHTLTIEEILDIRKSGQDGIIRRNLVERDRVIANFHFLKDATRDLFTWIDAATAKRHPSEAVIEVDDGGFAPNERLGPEAAHQDEENDKQ